MLLPSSSRTLVVDHNTTPPDLVREAGIRQRCLDAIARRDELMWADHIVTISEHTLEQHRARGVDPRRVSVMHLPPVVGSGAAVQGYPLIGNRPGPVHFLYVGRFVKAKGVPELLDSFERMVRRYGHDVRLTLVGHPVFHEDDVLQQIRDVIDRVGAGGSVRLAQGIPDAELEALYRSAHALVIPSYHEGYCIPVAEALWAGVYPITYDAANLPYVSGGLGALVPTGDRDALEREMDEFTESVLASRHDRQELRLRTSRFGVLSEHAWRAAAKSHLSDYSLEAYVDTFLRLLNGLAARRRDGAPEWLRRDPSALARAVVPLIRGCE